MAVPGGDAHETGTMDLGGVCDHARLTLPVPLFALGHGDATVLGRVLFDGMGALPCAVSSFASVAGRGLLTWLLLFNGRGCEGRVRYV